MTRPIFQPRRTSEGSRGVSPFQRRLASLTAAACLAALAACGSGADDPQTVKESPEAQAQFAQETAEAMQMQSLPWIPSMDPQQNRYGPFTPYAVAEVIGPWTVGPTPDGYKVGGNTNPNEFYRGTGSVEQGMPGYRVTLFIQVDYLADADAAAGLIFARYEDELAVLAIRGDGRPTLYLTNGGELNAPASFEYPGELGPGRHMIQAVLVDGVARLFVNGQYVGMFTSDYLVGETDGVGFFANGNAGMTIGAMTVEVLPRFTPPNGPPPATPG